MTCAKGRKGHCVANVPLRMCGPWIDKETGPLLQISSRYCHDNVALLQPAHRVVVERGDCYAGRAPNRSVRFQPSTVARSHCVQHHKGQGKAEDARAQEQYMRFVLCRWVMAYSIYSENPATRRDATASGDVFATVGRAADFSTTDLLIGSRFLVLRIARDRDGIVTVRTHVDRSVLLQPGTTRGDHEGATKGYNVLFGVPMIS